MLLVGTFYFTSSFSFKVVNVEYLEMDVATSFSFKVVNLENLEMDVTKSCFAETSLHIFCNRVSKCFVTNAPPDDMK